MIYFDYAANTPVDEDVLAAFCVATKTYFANPNASHPLGIETKEKMKAVTEAIAQHFCEDGEPFRQEDVIYTSGASEANNLAMKGIAESYRENGKHIISTFLEHSSVSATLSYLQKKGYEIDLVSLLPDGTIDMEHLKELMREDTILVSICAVDSEIGVIQPIKQIAELVQQYPHCFFHTDATQAVGKIKIDLSGVDCFTFTPHKFYGLNGTGALIKKQNLVLTPLIHGGASTTIYRSGTPVIAHAIAMEKALSISLEKIEERIRIVREKKDILLAFLKQNPQVFINSPANSSPYIINISVDGWKAKQVKEKLEAHGICISIKSACAVENTPSRPVMAMTKNRKRAMASFRISLSHQTTTEEIQQCYDALETSIEELKRESL